MKRGAKRWWVYLAAVPLANGKSAFRIGRTTDFAQTLRAINLSTPIKFARAWLLMTCSHRAALALEKELMRELMQYRSHGHWFNLSTADSETKQIVARAMARVAAMTEKNSDEDNLWRCAVLPR